MNENRSCGCKKIQCRNELLHWIDAVSFAAFDAGLYLDTHPDDTKAFAYFTECNNLRKDALDQYATYYGPLSYDTVMGDCSDRWNWINEPWPWQEGGCF